MKNKICCVLPLLCAVCVVNIFQSYKTMQKPRIPTSVLYNLGDMKAVVSKKRNVVSICGNCMRAQKGLLWERDYLYDIFGEFECDAVCTDRSDVYWYIKGDFPNLLPRILLHTSDETCSNSAALDSYIRFEHVFRQYACYAQYSHQYKKIKNMRIIPLGYMFGMIAESSTKHAQKMLLQTNNTRRYKWGFVGHMKSDRRSALDTFKNVQPHFEGAVSKLHIVDIYKESYFVISPGGNMNLDCFRHYEASMNGAIPVIVADMDEINNTFGHFISMPPWIFAHSWEAAKLKVQVLLADRKTLLDKRNLVLEWWIREMEDFTEKRH